jgi:signal transduction histidine kinase
MQFKLPSVIGSQDSIGWRTHLFFMFPAFLSALFFDYERFGGRPGVWVLLAIIGYLTTVAAIELFSWVFKKRNWKRPRPGLMIAILLVAGFVRGGVLFLSGTSLGVFPDSELLFRLTGGPVFVLASYLLLDSVLTSYFQHQKQLRKLGNQRDQLERAKAEFEAEISRLNDSQRARVRELVAPSIWELQKLMGTETKNIQDAIFTLKSLNESVVRPLSHEMSRPGNEIPEQQAELFDDNAKTGLFRGLPSKIELSTAINPLLFLMLTLVLSINSQTAVLGLVPGLTLVAFSLLIIMGLLVVTLWFLRSLVLSFPLAVLLTVFIGLVIGTLAGVTAAGLSLPASENFAIQAALMVSITLVFTLVLGVLKIERANSLKEIKETLEELRLLNSRLRQRVWLARKTLAMELHGSIQSTLQSVAARLSKLADPSENELAQSLDQVRAAFELVDNRDYLSGNTLSDHLGELILLWEGALDLQITLTPEAESALESDLAAARCALEVCREAITNAVKHGEAEQVRISILPGHGFVTIEAQNDGIKLDRESKGQGIDLYREVAHSFSLANTPDGVLLELQLPLSS